MNSRQKLARQWTTTTMRSILWKWYSVYIDRKDTEIMLTIKDFKKGEKAYSLLMNKGRNLFTVKSSFALQQKIQRQVNFLTYKSATMWKYRLSNCKLFVNKQLTNNFRYSEKSVNIARFLFRFLHCCDVTKRKENGAVFVRNNQKSAS